ncbi:hypothetical protein K438DRAFT_1959228 [Mycena galopus ATCC 62051]|nr:hypothetical protein K438DRAFT_1959228 [Mycena galopus ATCC 62051]
MPYYNDTASSLNETPALLICLSARNIGDACPHNHDLESTTHNTRVHTFDTAFRYRNLARRITPRPWPPATIASTTTNTRPRHAHPSTVAHLYNHPSTATTACPLPPYSYAVQIRCIRLDQTAVTNSLHCLSNGSAMIRFSWRKQEYVIPIMLVLKALFGASDKEIFEGVMMQDYENTFLTDRVELLLRICSP